MRFSTLLATIAGTLVLSFATGEAPAVAEGYDVYGNYYSDTAIDQIIEDTWPDEAQEYAKVIAERESGKTPLEYNDWDGDAFCLFQITDIAEVSLGISEANLDTPHECSYWAAQLYYQSLYYNGYGWTPWSETDY